MLAMNTTLSLDITPLLRVFIGPHTYHTHTPCSYWLEITITSDKEGLNAFYSTAELKKPHSVWLI